MRGSSLLINDGINSVAAGLRRLIIAVLVPVLGLSSLAVLPINQIAHAAEAYHVSGVVAGQDGTGLSGVTVYATAVNGVVAQFGPVLTANDGTYVLGVDVGTYDLHFNPNDSSGYLPTVQGGYVVTGNQVLNVQFASQTHTYSGYVRDAAGNPLPGIALQLSNASNSSDQVYTASDGHFSVSVVPGSYNLTVDARGNALQAVHFVMPSAGTIDLTSSDLTQDIRFDTVALRVQVKDVNGNPIPNVQVDAAHSNGSAGATSFLAGPAGAFSMTYLYGQKTTDVSGYATFKAVRGMTFPAAPVNGVPGGGDGICASINGQALCSTSDVTVSGDTTVVLQQSAPTRTYSGYAKDAAGNPLPGIALQLSNASNSSDQVYTASDGHFSVSVVPGSYKLSIDARGNALQAIHFVMPNAGEVNLTNGDLTQDIRFDTVTLRVQVKDASGNPVAGAQVNTAHNNGSAGATSFLAGPTGSFQMIYVGSQKVTDANGYASFVAVRGMTFPSAPADGIPGGGDGICASIDGQVLCSTGEVIIGGDTTVVLQRSVTRTYSGYARDTAGNPLPGIALQLSNASNSSDQVYTDSTGHFTISVLPGSYSLAIDARGNALPTVHFVVPNAGNVNLTNGDLTQDIRFDTVTLRVQVKDASGNPIPNIQVDAVHGNSSAGTTSFLSGPAGAFQMIYVNGQKATDSNGYATFKAVRGMTFPAAPVNGVPGGGDGICANINGQTLCSTSDVTVSGDATIVLQQAPPTPVAPSNLMAPNTTRLPVVLVWGLVQAATSYNVYRDGMIIASSEQASYQDTTASVGVHTYHVTAVNSAGESGPSNTVTVEVVANQPPAVGRLDDVTISLGGAPAWNGTFADPDSSSWTATVDYGDGSGVRQLPLAGYGFALGHVYGDPGTYTITVAITDEHGATGTATAHVVVQDTSAPVVAGQPDRVPDSGAWYNRAVTTTWFVTDADNQVTIPDPTVVDSEGRDQNVTSAQSCDRSGNCAAGVYFVSLDKTAPQLNVSSWTSSSVPTTGTTTVTVPATDNLSGMARAEYFVGDVDPGVGNGTSMILANMQSNGAAADLMATIAGSNYQPGMHKITFRAQDDAGNWSYETVDYFVVFDAAGPQDLSGGKQFVPSAGDLLPFYPLSGGDKASIGFHAFYTPSGGVDPTSELAFDFEIGRCKGANPQGCHTFNFTAMSVDQLVLSGQNSSAGTFYGNGTLAIDGATTTRPYKIVARDGARVNPATTDSGVLYIYTAGTNPVTAGAGAEQYRVALDTNGNWVTIQ